MTPNHLHETEYPHEIESFENFEYMAKWRCTKELICHKCTNEHIRE